MTLVDINCYYPHGIYYGKRNHLVPVGAESIPELPPTKLDIVVLTDHFFTLKSYTFSNASCTTIRFCTTSLNESRELQGTIYINTQMS
jgi:hypothetical protein